VFIGGFGFCGFHLNHFKWAWVNVLHMLSVTINYGHVQSDAAQLFISRVKVYQHNFFLCLLQGYGLVWKE
jgi:hypothetical protein